MSQVSPSTALQRTALLCSVWISLAIGSLGLAAILDGTALASDLLPDPIVRTLVSFELFLLAGSVAALGGVLMLLWVALTLVLRSPTGQRVAWVLVSVLASLPLGLYGLSWAVYRSTGRFLDSHGIEFMSANPLQFMQHAVHIDPLLFFLVPVALTVATVSITWGLPLLLGRAGSPLLWWLHAATAALLALFVYIAADWRSDGIAETFSYVDLTQPVVDPDAGLIYTYDDLYVRSRDEGTGPLTHALADLRDLYGAGQTLPPLEPNLAFEHRPIVSMDEYLSGVDRDNVARHNVLLVVIESLRPDQLQSFDGDREVMPTLESIAAESRRYGDHYAQASHSNYADICLLSSHYPLRSERAHVYPKNPTYPRILIYDVLKALGWRTAVVSSQNESWGKMINYLRTGSIDHFFHSETFEGETYVPRNDEGFQDFLTGSKRSGKIDDRFTIAEAIRWIDEGDGEQPFFMYLNLQNSHLPYETPADFPRPFGPDEIDFTIRFSGYPLEHSAVVKDLYSDSLAYVDSQLKRLVDHLKQRGLWEDTVVVVTGDTGQAFGEHGFVAHANMVFEELVRVPLIVKAPGFDAGPDDRPAQHIDLPPSILDVLGLPPHPGMQGISLLDPDPHRDRFRYVMVQTPIAHQYGIIWKRFKLIYDVTYGKELFFDRMDDPGEVKLFGAKYPGIQKRMSERLNSWRNLQLSYYRDTQLHSQRYPPVLAE